MKEQKAHAVSVIEEDRFRQMLQNAYTVLQKGGTTFCLFMGRYKFERLDQWCSQPGTGTW